MLLAPSTNATNNAYMCANNRMIYFTHMKFIKKR